jgi:hypothetical protein
VQEAAVFALITPRTSDLSAEFLARGAQAFFYQAVIYRNAGWIESDQDALATLEAQLQSWLRI